MRFRSGYAAFAIGLASSLTLALSPQAVAQSPDRAAAIPAERLAAAPPMWRVSDEDSVIYLFGTIHFLRADVDWRPDYVAKALDASETLWLEADTESPAATQAAANYAAAKGRLQPGQSLLAMLGEEDADKLRRMATAISAPLAEIDTMRPWLAFMALSYFAPKAEGFDPETGAEKVLTGEWRARGRQIRYFEPIEKQLGIFGDLSPEIQQDLLVMTLDEWERGETSMEALFTAWRNGNASELGDILNDNLSDVEPVVFARLLTDRNWNWAQQIELEMRGSGTEFVAVGAGHLVGEGSLPALLREKGFTVERYGAAAGEPANDNTPADAIGGLLEDLEEAAPNED